MWVTMHECCSSFTFCTFFSLFISRFLVRYIYFVSFVCSFTFSLSRSFHLLYSLECMCDIMINGVNFRMFLCYLEHMLGLYSKGSQYYVKSLVFIVVVVGTYLVAFCKQNPLSSIDEKKWNEICQRNRKVFSATANTKRTRNAISTGNTTKKFIFSVEWMNIIDMNTFPLVYNSLFIFLNVWMLAQAAYSLRSKDRS